jgi:hypothetical protein
MSSQGVATTIVYMAYNTSTGAYVTGDQANHTLKLVKDGTEASPTNSSAEVDSTNTPGAYKLALTAAETNFGTVWLGGKSSTANVIIIPITVTFEILPTALDANGFVKADVEDIAGATVATGTAQLGINVVNWRGGAVPAVTVTGVPKVDVADWLGTAVTAATAGIPDVNTKNKNNAAALTDPTNFGSLGISAGGHISNVDTLTTYTGNTVQTGDAFARLGAPAGASVSADVAAVKTDTGNTVATTNKLAFTVANKVDSNILAINGNATAAASVAHTNQALARGTVGNASSTTSIVCSAIASPASVGASGQFNGRTILFDADTTTTNLQGQATNITGNTTGATPTFTVIALTTAPVSGDLFSIV